MKFKGTTQACFHWAWDQFRTYKTERQLCIRDTRIGGLHKAFLASAAVYLVYTILTSHSYLKKETPVVSINSWVEGVHNFLDKQRDLRAKNATLPWYCVDTSKTAYVYGPEFLYFNNTCDLRASGGSATLEDSSATEFVTYYQETPLDEDLGYPPKNAFIPGKPMLIFLCPENGTGYCPSLVSRSGETIFGIHPLFYH